MLKTVSSTINAIGALNYQGTWDASTNNPTLTSSVGTKGDYYVVSVAGSTNLNGETLWGVGDWAVFNGSIWQKVDGGDTGNFATLTVTGLTGYMFANGSNAVTASTTIPVANVTGAVANTVNVLTSGLLSGGGALTGNVTITLNNVPSGNVTGLGTMATQNANNVTITGGSISVPNLNDGYTSTAASVTPVVLTSTSNHWQKTSGTGTQTYTLPDATTLANGTSFVFDNDATGVVTINDSTSALVDVLIPGAVDFIFLESNATAAGVWGKYSWLPAAVNWGNTTADFGGVTVSNVSISSANVTGLGTMSSQNANAVAITGGTANVTVNFLNGTASSATMNTSMMLAPAGYINVALSNATVVKIPYYAA